MGKREGSTGEADQPYLNGINAWRVRYARTGHRDEDGFNCCVNLCLEVDLGELNATSRAYAGQERLPLARKQLIPNLQESSAGVPIPASAGYRWSLA